LNVGRDETDKNQTTCAFTPSNPDFYEISEPKDGDEGKNSNITGKFTLRPCEDREPQLTFVCGVVWCDVVWCGEV
jgi:hypothetical protein